MRLTIVGPAYPLRGGIAHHVYWLHRELTSRGHEVQVLSYRSLYPRLLFPGSSIFDTSQLKLDSGARPVLAPLNPLSWIQCLRAARKFSPELVIVEWWNTFFAPLVGTLVRMLARSGLKCVIECHNVLPHERRLIDRSLLKFAFSPVDDFITHSNSDRDELLGLLPAKRVEVAGLPVLDEFSGQNRRHSAGKARTILFFGIVRKYKGLDVLLRAMPKVLSHIDCNLVVAGEFYDPLAKYQAMVRELGIEGRVRIENRYVPNEEVPELISQADVLVLPYLSATQSGVARIATANRLPIIASRTGGLSEAVAEGLTGLLFPPGDADALASCIVQYFTGSTGEVLRNNLLSAGSVPEGPRLANVVEEFAGQGQRANRGRSAVPRH